MYVCCLKSIQFIKNSNIFPILLCNQPNENGNFIILPKQRYLNALMSDNEAETLQGHHIRAISPQITHLNTAENDKFENMPQKTPFAVLLLPPFFVVVLRFRQFFRFQLELPFRRLAGCDSLLVSADHFLREVFQSDVKNKILMTEI